MYLKRCFSLSLFFCGLSFGQATETPAPPRVDVNPATKVVENRQHIIVTSAAGNDDFVVTQISQRSDNLDRTIILIRTSAGDRLMTTREWDYEKQIAFSEIRDVRSDEFLRATFTYPISTKTRRATLEIVSKNPQLLSIEVPFEISVHGPSRVSGIASHWEDPITARDWRTRVRQMISPNFLETLELVETSGLLKQPALASIHEMLMGYVLYRTNCNSGAGLSVEPAAPDCGFDKDFSYPCSEDQLKRAKAAGGEKKANRY